MLKIDTVVGGMIGTNSYLLEEDNKILLIDFVPEIEEIIEDNKYIVEKILLTHTHFDHFEGLSKFQKKYSFELYLSDISYKILNKPDDRILAFFPPKVHSNYKNMSLEKARICKDDDIINWNNHKIKIVESPGHSPDGLMFILEDKKLVFTGDTIFNGSVGRTDLPGGNFNQMIESINKLFLKVNDDYILYPGHGPQTNVDFEKNNNPFLINN